MFSIVDLPGHRNRLARGDANKPRERPRKAWMAAAKYPGGNDATQQTSTGQYRPPKVAQSKQPEGGIVFGVDCQDK